MLGWELPPYNSGGLGVACYYLSKALALEGATIDFVVPYAAEHPNVDFMEVHHATNVKPSERKHLGAYESSFINNYDPSGKPGGIRAVQKQYTRFVEQLTEDSDYDAIHANDWLTIEAGIRAKQLTKAPLIVHVHATEFDRAGGNYGNPLIHEIEQQGLLVADRIIAVSQFTKDLIIEKYDIEPDKIEVVHNTLDVKSLDDGYLYDEATYTYLEGLKQEGYTIVSSVARLSLQKGIDHLIRAFARATQKYDRLALLLAGDGEYRDEMVELVAELGIADRVFFTGFVRGKQWRDAYSVSDVFVMSSVSEPFGLSALEAAHHDTALILSKQTGVSEILKNTLKYDFWDIDRLADQIVGIATSDALSLSLRENVAQEYAQLSWQDVAKQCLDLYGLVKAKRGVPA